MIERLPLLAWPSGPMLSIFIYHRVLERASTLFPEELDATRFERQMRYLSANFTVLPLFAAVQALAQGSLPRRACCITFDDGYADNLSVALPVLERYGLSATVFVASGYTDGGCMFNDAIVHIVGASPRASLDLCEHGLGQHELATPADRRAAILAIVATKRFLPPKQRSLFVAELARIAGVSSLPRELMLTRTQIAELARRGIEIGGHTASHPVLSSIAADEARAEIAQGKRDLEEWTDRPVRCFAYPNGLPGRDFSAEHAGIVRELGFALAVTTASGIATPAADRFHLPRFMPWGSSLFGLGSRLLRRAWSVR